MTDEKPKTMEGILADVAALKAQTAASASGAPGHLPLGAKVRLSGEAHARLTKDRARPGDRIGEVTGFDDRSGRNLVQWSEPVPHVEPLAAKFLEIV